VLPVLAGELLKRKKKTLNLLEIQTPGNYVRQDGHPLSCIFSFQRRSKLISTILVRASAMNKLRGTKGVTKGIEMLCPLVHCHCCLLTCKLSRLLIHQMLRAAFRESRFNEPTLWIACYTCLHATLACYTPCLQVRCCGLAMSRSHNSHSSLPVPCIDAS
jgi:hypothetical protein